MHVSSKGLERGAQDPIILEVSTQTSGLYLIITITNQFTV